MADERLRTSEIVEDDGAIERLIAQLESLNAQYGATINTIKNGARDIVRAISSINSATAQSRAAIDENAASASRLERAQRELQFAMSDTGKQVAWLKSQIQQVNRASVEQQKSVKAIESSYERLKLELADNVKLWKSLSEAERNDAAIGGQVLNNILSIKEKIGTLDNELRIHVQTLTEVEKAEQRLAYLRSSEGQRLLAIKKEISEVIRASREERASVDELAKAQERLQKARSASNVQIKLLNQQADEANRIARLQAQLQNSAVGSYNQLAAQYELNKIKLNAMSTEERHATEAGKALEQQTLEIYKRMMLLQEATGNHRLSVGNYAKTWNGLGNAMNQIVREIPAATIGINTFFLAISNNVPILIDEIQRTIDKNKLLRAEGKPTQSVIKTIVGSLISWQTALILVITALSMHGKEIFAWFKKLAKGPGYIMNITELLKAMKDELKTTNASYGQNIVTVKELQSEWQKLATQKEQLQWIADNKSEFDKLGISINNVIDAENVFVDNTDALIDALKLRAKAAAAMKLAADKYEQALIKVNEAETLEQTGPDFIDKFYVGFLNALTQNQTSVPFVSNPKELTAEGVVKSRIDYLRQEAEAAEADGDAFFKLADAYEIAAKERLKAAGIEAKHKNASRTGRQPRDLTDTINRNEITLQKKYEASITALLHDEYAKRRKEAMDETQAEIADLRERYRKNEEYVKNIEGKYRELTAEQRKQIAQQQKWILDTIEFAQKKLTFDLEQIERERQVNSLKIMRETIDWQLDEIANSIDDEMQLKLQQINEEEKLVKQSNALVKDGVRTDAEITAEYEKKRMQIVAKYEQQIQNLKKQSIENQVELVKKGTNDELKLLIEQNENARRLAILQNAAKPAGEQQSVDEINAVYDKRGRLIQGAFSERSLNDQQKLAEAVFDIDKHNQRDIMLFNLQQEKERWKQQIKLAKEGALDWSDAQIAAAEATVKGIDRQIAELNNVINLFGEKGLTGGLLTMLGFDDDAISAFENSADIILDYINEIMQAEVDLAQIAVDKAKERVDAAKSVYDAEIEGRNNGYANNVATAKKELQQERKNQAAKEKILLAAQRRQERVQAAIQASSLVTASAELWSAFASVPIVGPALALAAIAAMWTSFGIAKVKAAQVTKAQSQEYGEGGLEFLEGGSHASGHDIDLQTKNSKGKNMRAEGGEAMAIINKRSTRRYRRQLPSIIESLNKGTFEDKYLKAFEHGETLQAQIIASNSSIVDLSRVERSVDAIRKQNEHKMLMLNNGTVVEIKGNVTRYYRR